MSDDRIAGACSAASVVYTDDAPGVFTVTFPAPVVAFSVYIAENVRKANELYRDDPEEYWRTAWRRDGG
jgi:hypothetical protein